MITFLQLLFQGPEQLLREAANWMNNLSSVAAAGLNISDYVSWIGYLGGPWQKVVNSLLASLTLIGVLFIVRAIYRAYLGLKEGIQWW